jgi:Fe2+ or Zn2+ uptake regulation protein
MTEGALLCVKTCDKCGKIIEKTQDVFVVSDGKIVHSNELLGLKYDLVYYVCHKDCWDGTVDMEWA